MGIRVFSGGGGGTTFVGGTLTADLLFSPDNTIDIGASGANRPRTAYIGTSAVIGSAGTLAGAAANVLELRSGTTAQEFRVYNTYTSSTDYEALRVGYVSSGRFYVGTAKGSGGGADKPLFLKGTSTIGFDVGSNGLFENTDAPDFGAYTSNNSNLGRSGAFWRTLYLATSEQGGGTKALTETTATGFVTLTTATADRIGGYIRYVIEATDATDHQARSGILKFAIVDKAGTAVCTLSADAAEAYVETAGASTLTNTFDASVSGHVTTIRANATSSLAQTALNIKYFVNVCNTTTVTQL